LDELSGYLVSWLGGVFRWLDWLAGWRLLLFDWLVWAVGRVGLFGWFRWLDWLASCSVAVPSSSTMVSKGLVLRMHASPRDALGSLDKGMAGGAAMLPGHAPKSLGQVLGWLVQLPKLTGQVPNSKGQVPNSQGQVPNSHGLAPNQH